MAALREMPLAVAVIHVDGIADIAQIIATKISEQIMSAAILRLPTQPAEAGGAPSWWYLGQLNESLLAVVLIGFGMASYYGVSRMRYQEVDSELERSVQLLAASFFSPRPLGEPQGRRGGDMRGPFDRGQQFNPYDGRRGQYPTSRPFGRNRNATYR